MEELNKRQSRVDGKIEIKKRKKQTKRKPRMAERSKTQIEKTK